MVGKPNLPADYKEKEALKGAAMVSSGLDPLDQEREASMADEGGASGAVMETQLEVSRPVSERVPSAGWILLALAGAALAAIGYSVYGRRQDIADALEEWRRAA